MNVYLPLQVDVFIFYHQELWCQFFPERIYNSNYSKEGAGNVYLLVLSSWKVNIVENPIAVMGLQISCKYVQAWTVELNLNLKCQTS